MDIFCLVLITPFVQAAFYEKIDSKSVHFSEVISETSAPSTIACIHHCRYIDKEAATIYMNNVCKCVKKSEASGTNDMTVSGVFLQEVSNHYLILKFPEPFRLPFFFFKNI